MMKFLKKPIFANLLWGEIILLSVGAFLTGIIVFPFVHFRGSEWDTLLYLNTAQSPGPNAGILNRYTHIYLQKIFLLFFSPLDAAKALWAFQVFATGILVYLSAKLLNKKNSVWTGVLALVFFFAQRELFSRSGIPLVDFTTMLLLMVGVFIYLLYIRSKNKPVSLLLLLGLVQFLLLKSKETGIIFLPILAAAIYLSAGDWRARARNAFFVVGGGLLGIGLFIFLDGIFLGDPLFSLRPESWKALLTFNLTLVYEQRSEQSWYVHIFTTALLVPFLLGVFALLKDKKGDYTWAERAAWLLPLVHVLFLSVLVFRASFPLSFRYLYPSFPVIAMLGAQFLAWRDERQRRQAWLTLAASALVALLLFVILYPYAASLPFRWTEDNFFSSIMTSVLLSAFFFVLVLPQTSKINRNLYLLPVVAVLAFTPIWKIPNEIGHARQMAEQGFSPFAIYREDIQLREGLNLFFSSQPYTEFDLLGRNNGSSEYMFEAYFNISVARADYSANIVDFLLADYDYGFFTRDEYSSSFMDDDLLQNGYAIFDDPRSDVILIAKVQP